MSGNVGVLLEELEVLLNERGVRHGRLRLEEVNNNYAFVDDGSNVFIKVNVMEGGSALRREVSFLDRFGGMVDAPALLVGEAVPVLDGKHYAVVYEYERFDDITYGMVEGLSGAGLLSGVTEQMRKFHALPVEGTVPSLSLSSVRGKVDARLQHFAGRSGGDGFMASQVSRYREVFESFVGGEWGQYVADVLSAGGVVCHGDTHIGNFVLKEGEVRLIDYESVTVAPLEYDLVSLLLPLKFHYGSADAAGRLVQAFPGVDLGLLEGLMFMKMLSASSFLLVSGEMSGRELFCRRVDALEKSLSAGEVLAYPM